MEKCLRVNLLGPGPRLMKKEFTGPRLRNTVLNGTDGQTDRYGGTDSCFSQFHESTQTWKQYFGRKGCPSRSTN